jgi:hypothetical protein
MTTEQATTLIFRNEAGDYLLVPRETLERGRVPDDHKTGIERLLAEADGDVSGYMVATTYTLLRAISTGAKAIGDFTADAALVQWIEQQMISGGKA